MYVLHSGLCEQFVYSLDTENLSKALAKARKILSIPAGTRLRKLPPQSEGFRFCSHYRYSYERGSKKYPMRVRGQFMLLDESKLSGGKN